MSYIERLHHGTSVEAAKHKPLAEKKRADAPGSNATPSAPSRVRSCDLPSAILQSAEDAIVGLALDGTIVSWNAAAEHLYGFAPHEAIGQPFSLILGSDASTELLRVLAELPAGKRFAPTELECTRKDKTLAFCSLSVSPICRRREKSSAPRSSRAKRARCISLNASFATPTKNFRSRFAASSSATAR